MESLRGDSRAPTSTTNRTISHNTIGDNARIFQGDVHNAHYGELLPTANDAAFDSYAEQHNARCHPDTRTELLRQIQQWADDPRREYVFWLNGMAGTGKSTISRTVARRFEEAGMLGASFFFRRGEGDRGHARLLFTTIASQLMSRGRALRQDIESAIHIDQGLRGKALQEQFEKLILRPLQNQRGGAGNPSTMLLVVDALDECDGEDDVGLIIHLLAQMGSAYLKIFVTSRPDLPIRLGFEDIEGCYEHVALHKIPEVVTEHDISTYMRHELARIGNKYKKRRIAGGRELPLDWPGEDVVQILVRRASPLFIFAATLCRFIDDRAWSDPVRQLEKLLGQVDAAESELDKLDATYLPILNQLIAGCDDPGKSRLVGEFREVVGPIVLLVEPLSISSLAHLLDIPRHVVAHRLDTLHSVLHIPSEQDLPVKPLHLSFRNFLTDSSKSKMKFWVDARKYHERIANQCLQVLILSGHLKRDMCGLEKPGKVRTEVQPEVLDTALPMHVRYACQYWVYHMQQGKAQIRDGEQPHLFLRRHFLHWLEALSLLGKISESLIMINSLQTLVEPQTGAEMSAFLHDAERFILNCLTVVEDCPLQLYLSAIIFAPEKSVIRSIFIDEASQSVSVVSGIDSQWGACCRTIEGNGGYTDNALVYSPDSKYLACGSNKQIRIWDIATGRCRLTLDCGDSRICSIAFSHNSKQLAAAVGNAIKVWDAATGLCRQTLTYNGRGFIVSVAFSCDSKRLASASDDLKIWDVQTGQCSQTLVSHDARVSSVAFSPDSKYLASASYDGKIKIWYPATGQCRLTLPGHTESISSVAFSSTSEHLASASYDGTVKIWVTADGRCCQTLRGHDMNVKSVVFLHDSKTLASASYDSTIKIWDVATGRCLQTLNGHNNPVSSVAFSPASKHLASAAFNGAVKLWDTVVGQHVPVLDDDGKSVCSLVFSPDFKYLASAFDDYTVKICDAETGRHRQTLYDCDSFCELFSFDSKYFASARENTVKIWCLATGQCHQMDEDSGEWATSIAFSHDSKSIAIAFRNGMISIRDVPAGQCLQTIDVSRVIYYLEFDTSDSRLRTEYGPIELDRPRSLYLAVREPRTQPPGYGISPSDDWVTWKSENILWLPPEYRPTLYWAAADAISTMAIGPPSGRVLVLRFAANYRPLAHDDQGDGVREGSLISSKRPALHSCRSQAAPPVPPEKKSRR